MLAVLSMLWSLNVLSMLSMFWSLNVHARRAVDALVAKRVINVVDALVTTLWIIGTAHESADSGQSRRDGSNKCSFMFGSPGQNLDHFC